MMAETQRDGLPEEREAYSDDDSDDVSLFEYVGDQGDGTVSQLCAHCQWMLDNWALYEEDSEFTFAHHSNISQLIEAAAAGCALCQQFQNSGPRYTAIPGSTEFATGLHVEEEEFIRPDESITTSTVTLKLRMIPNYNERIILKYYRQYNDEQNKTAEKPPDQTPEGQDSPEFESDDDNDYEDDEDSQISDSPWRTFMVFQVKMFPATYSALRTESYTATKLSTSDSLNLAERWLRRCQKSHWKCNNSIGDFMPTRLITTTENVVRLCLAKDISEPLQYATLSHCWGATKFATLTTDNLALFQTRIPTEALSGTIKDAIHIAKRLGFSYIWIDTLCIIQDDPDDWARESSSMSAVYGHSHLNIAASGAIDGSVGCFFNRLHHWRCQAEVKIGGIAKRHDFVASPFGHTSPSSMPLMQRAWAFQERLLPARTLHFTKTEVFWECYHKSACESFPERMPWQCGLTEDSFIKQPLASSMWTWIVERYSGCELTVPEDKLVAISGLAQHIQNQTKDQYVAGMWRDGLEFQLCWITEYPHSCKQTDSYIAPSWSWASLSSTITLSSVDRIQKSKSKAVLWITIIDVALEPSKVDPFGSLADAKLRLSCSSLTRTNIIMDARNESDYLVFGTERIECSIHYDIRDEEDEEECHDVYVLPVFEHLSGQDITGLLLERSGNQKGIYRRVGRFRVWGEDSSSAIKRAIAALPHKVKAKDCYEVRVDRSGNPCHIIHLI